MKYENIFALLEKTTIKNQKKVALGMKTMFGWNEFTYKGLSLLTQRLGSYLMNDLQIPKGEKIAILSESIPEYGVCLFGSMLAGLTIVPLDNKLTIYELTSILSNCLPTVLLTSSKHFKNAQELQKRIPSIKHIIVMEPIGYESPETPSLYSIPANYSVKKWRRRPLSDTALIIYTSGTTGAPKGVQTTYKNMLAQMYDMRKVFKNMMPEDGNMSLLSILPMNHLFELTVGFFTMLNHGYTVYYTSSLKPKDVLDILEEKEIRFMVTVPAFLKLLKAYFESEISKRSQFYQTMFKIKYELARFLPTCVRRRMFRTIHRLYGGKFFGYISGGAPLDPIVGNFFKRIGVRIFQGYGLSETSPVVSMCNDPHQDTASVGPILDSYDAKVDEETGELLVKGPSVMKGYYRRDDLTADVIDKDGWLHTGDIAEIKNGLLYITGRIKNMIVLSGGKKVFPEEVETVMQQSENFAEVCIVGMPKAGGEKDGCEEIVAVIVPTPEFASKFPSTDELEKAVKAEVKTLSGQLAPYKRPINIVVRTETLPRTSTSKVRRKAVKELLCERA